jgi:hypothetical protein
MSENTQGDCDQVKLIPSIDDKNHLPIVAVCAADVQGDDKDVDLTPCH